MPGTILECEPSEEEDRTGRGVFVELGNGELAMTAGFLNILNVIFMLVFSKAFIINEANSCFRCARIHQSASPAATTSLGHIEVCAQFASRRHDLPTKRQHACALRSSRRRGRFEARAAICLPGIVMFFGLLKT